MTPAFALTDRMAEKSVLYVKIIRFFQGTVKVQHLKNTS